MRGKVSTTTGNSGAHTSPGTPEHGDDYGGGISKGWSSERVPLPVNSSRRQINAAAGLMPFNSGRALPSKWDDAERWITSPVSGAGASSSSSSKTQKKPKSKSGPLGPPGVLHLPNYSPRVAMLGNGNGGNDTIGSPLTTGVFMPDGVSIHYGMGNGAKSKFSYNESMITQSIGLSGLSDLVSEPSVPNSRDDGVKEAEAVVVSRVVSRRDMATQMSPGGSTHSSYNARSSFSVELELPSNLSGGVEVRDVQVDKGATFTKLSRKPCRRKTRKRSSEIKEMASSWDVGDSTKHTSKLQREEAKISAWENLQKAKAEAAIRKLEMKLEKKRSASTDRILHKLKAAQMKAQAMRRSRADNQVRPSPTISPKLLFRRYIKKCSVFSCFFSPT